MPPVISTSLNVAVPPVAVRSVPTITVVSVSTVVNSPDALVDAPIVPVTEPKKDASSPVVPASKITG